METVVDIGGRCFMLVRFEVHCHVHLIREPHKVFRPADSAVSPVAQLPSYYPWC